MFISRRPDPARARRARAGGRLAATFTAAAALVTGLVGPLPGPTPTPAGAQAPPHDFVVYDLGALRDPDRVLGRDAGASGLVGEQSLWAYGDTFLEGGPAQDGTASRTNTGALNLPSYYRLREPLDSTGAPAAPLIPYSSSETPYNQPHLGRYVIWPSSVISRGSNPGLVYYKRAYTPAAGGIAPNSEQVGLATVNPGSTTAYRHPTPLFLSDECQWGIPFLAPDGYIYFYARLDDRPNCPDRPGANPTGVARVPLGSAGTRSAFTFWNGTSWTANQNATAALPGFEPWASSPSVIWSAPLDAYVAITGGGDSSVFATAPAPQGPWTPFAHLTDVMPSDDGLSTRAFRLHPELGSSDGGLLVMSYFREDYLRTNPYPPPFDWRVYKGQIRLVAIDVRPDAPTRLQGLVTRAYQAILGAAPSTTARDQWVSRLRNREISAEELTRSLRTSLAGRRAVVQERFQAVLGRAAGASEQDYWADWLATSGRSHDNLTASLVNSAEFRSTHPAASTIVPAVYQIALGRTVDTPAYNHWVGLLNQGQISVPNFVLTVMRTAEAADRQTRLAYNAVLGRDPNPTEMDVVSDDFVPVLERSPGAVRAAVLATGLANA